MSARRGAATCETPAELSDDEQPRAALVRVLSEGPPPAEYVPRRSGYGAGTRDPKGRANALRLILADTASMSAVLSESLVAIETGE